MLQINVAQLLKEPVGAIRKYDIEGEVELDKGLQSPIHGKVVLTHTPRSILVKGEISGQATVACSRCLGICTCPLTIDFDEEYFPLIDLITGLPLPKPEEPGSFMISERHILDITEAIRQYAVLQIPMKPLCKEDCAGICPQCGKNLNEESCTCPVEQMDPRWAALKNIKS